MKRTLLAALLAGALASPMTALADVAPMPTVLHFEGERTAVTTSGPPDHARFTVRNTASASVEVFFYRALLRADGMNVPMEITRLEVEGRGDAEGRRVRVPGDGEVRVTVFFDLPDRYRGESAWEVDLRVTADAPGGWDSSPARLTRARREPARRKLFTGPKDRAATPRAPRR